MRALRLRLVVSCCVLATVLSACGGGSGGGTTTYDASLLDGSLTVNPMGDPIEGGFSAGGTYAIIAGPTNAMTNPGMYFLMRR